MADPARDSDESEHILCDTSFVSLVDVASARPDLIAHWPQAVRARLDVAVLAITVFVLGELRSGRIKAGWNEQRIEKAERALAAYLFVPVDPEVLDCYVGLRARYLSQLGDNDLWIAATAKARGWPLVACDLDFCRLKTEIELIYLPHKPDSPSECP